MTAPLIFEAAADTPAWMHWYNRLPHRHDELGVSVEAPPVPVDPVRHWLLEVIADNGQVMRRWRGQTTLAAALWWKDTTTCPPGHRIVMTEVTK